MTILEIAITVIAWLALICTILLLIAGLKLCIEVLIDVFRR